MSAAGTSPARRTRYARWLGLDHNPLRRRADRLEVTLRLVILILILAGVPLASTGVGLATDHTVIRQSQAERAADHQVRAALTQAAPAHGSRDPYTGVQTAWAPARWVAANGTIHFGQALARAGSAKGSTVAIWITAAGTATTRPQPAATSSATCSSRPRPPDCCSSSHSWLFRCSANTPWTGGG